LNRGHCRCTRTADERDIDEAFLPKQGGDYAEFQAWACICWHKKGSLYIHGQETAEERQVSEGLIEAENTNNKEMYKKKWEAGQALVDLGRTRTRKGKPPSYEVFWNKAFKVGRKVDGEGIDWYLHQFRILRPLFVPFIREIQAKYARGRDVHIIEDGASATSFEHTLYTSSAKIGLPTRLISIRLRRFGHGSNSIYLLLLVLIS
jgi:hypothetical protein